MRRRIIDKLSAVPAFALMLCALLITPACEPPLSANGNQNPASKSSLPKETIDKYLELRRGIENAWQQMEMGAQLLSQSGQLNAEDRGQIDRMRAQARASFAQLNQFPPASMPSGYFAAKLRQLKPQYWGNNNWKAVRSSSFAGLTEDDSLGGNIVVCKSHMLSAESGAASERRSLSYAEYDKWRFGY